VTLATVKTAYSSNAKCILAFTNGGSTARLISRLRPQMPIVALTCNQKSYHQLAIEWGIIPFIGKNTTNTADAFRELSRHCLSKKYVNVGDLVVIAAGSPFGVSGSTNQMLVDTIGDVL